MIIVIDLKACYDWEHRDAVPTAEDVATRAAKKGADDKWLWKKVREVDTHTAINLPEAEIADCSAHFARAGAPKTRAQLVAWYLHEKVMPHHAATEHFVRVTVHGEPDVEAFLNTYFGLNQTAVAG